MFKNKDELRGFFDKMKDLYNSHCNLLNENERLRKKVTEDYDKLRKLEEENRSFQERIESICGRVGPMTPNCSVQTLFGYTVDQLQKIVADYEGSHAIKPMFSFEHSCFMAAASSDIERLNKELAQEKQERSQAEFGYKAMEKHNQYLRSELNNVRLTSDRATSLLKRMVEGAAKYYPGFASSAGIYQEVLRFLFLRTKGATEEALGGP